MSRRYRFLSVLAVAGLLAGCAGSSASPSAAAGTINATLQDQETPWSIVLSGTPAAGEVTFNIANNGEKTHEFVVVKTALAVDALPLNAAGDEVVEDDPALTAVDEKEDILAGTSTTLTVTLDAGHYVIFCNLTEHYNKGMRTEVTVS